MVTLLTRTTRMGRITRISKITGIPRMTGMNGGWDVRYTRITGMSRMTGLIWITTCTLKNDRDDTGETRLTRMHC